MAGVQIGDRHTNEWGLHWIDFTITAPQAQTMTIEIPGRDGVLDLTASLGDRVRFNNRTLEFTFVLHDKDMKKWHNVYSEISNFCHGKVMDIIPDTDIGYFWNGRCSCTSTKEDGVHSSIVITVDAAPYKRGVVSTDEEWLWDPFNLDTGVIQNLGDIAFENKVTIKAIGYGTTSQIRITCSKEMKVQFLGITYDLKKGEQYLKDIILSEGDNTLVFTCDGSGIVSIGFREESL